MNMKHAMLFLLLCFACTPAEQSTQQNDEVTNTIPSLESKELPGKTETPAVDEDQPAEITSKEGGPLVYVTQDGDKYHTADCRYSKTAQTVSLGQAKADGKTACGICKPNSTTGEKQIRCSGNTAEGKRCQRMTTDASGKCFQHRGN